VICADFLGAGGRVPQIAIFPRARVSPVTSQLFAAAAG